MKDWIDLEDKTYYTSKSGKRRLKYRVTCSMCGCDRGYIMLQNAKDHPTCVRCHKGTINDTLVEHNKKNGPWNKGLKDCFSDETKKKIGLASANRNYTSDKKKQIAAKRSISLKLLYSDPKKKKLIADKREKLAAKKIGISVEEWKAKRKLKKNTRAILYHRLKRRALHKKKNSTFDILGYTVDDLKTHLERLFQPGMSWDNYGNEWHIDHIKPDVLFKYSEISSDEFKKCWSLDNLQPLWAKDNIAKSCKW